MYTALMLNSLTGTLTGKFPQRVTLDTHGIEWDILVPESALDRLPGAGESARIFTWLQHTESSMVLFGFASDQDRSLFFDLLKVDGIGPKGALRILGSISAAELSAVLDSGDVGMLEKVPGVGKKTAAKMMLQLKGKLTVPQEGGPGRPLRKGSPFADVVTALVSMGYDRRVSEQKVDEIAADLSADEAFSSRPAPEREDVIFRRAIVELAQ